MEGISLDVLVSYLTPEVLWISFAIVSAFSIAMSTVLFYHWNAYNYKSPALTKAKGMYLTGLIALLLSGAIIITLMSNSA